MQSDIVRIAAEDDDVIEGVLTLLAKAHAIDVPDLPPPCRHRFRAEQVHDLGGEWTHIISRRRCERYVARHGQTLMGYLELVLSTSASPSEATLRIVVDPDYRRQGTGRELYSFATARTRALGRSRVAGASVEGIPGGAIRPEAGRSFARAVGAARAVDALRLQLDLATVDDDVLETRVQAAVGKAPGYRLVTWRARAPSEFAEDVAYLNGRLLSDSPTGDLNLEGEEIDVARLREDEEALADCRYRTYHTGAVHEGDGRLVAVTTIGLEESHAWHGYQWITLVDPGHRGHRLGSLIKTRNLAHVRTHEPEVRIIDTWCAAANRHMIAINESMGFEVVDKLVYWQKGV